MTNITGLTALLVNLASPYTQLCAQMADREQVQTLFDQFEATCKTARLQEFVDAGAVAWQSVLADMRAKIPDVAAQGKVIQVVYTVNSLFRNRACYLSLSTTLFRSLVYHPLFLSLTLFLSLSHSLSFSLSFASFFSLSRLCACVCVCVRVCACVCLCMYFVCLSWELCCDLTDVAVL
jgi:hypothetical protein